MYHGAIRHLGFILEVGGSGQVANLCASDSPGVQVWFICTGGRGQGRIQDFKIEGRITNAKRGPKGPLKGTGSSMVLIDLSCYMRHLKHSDTKPNKKKHSRSKFRGGAHLLRPALDPPLGEGGGGGGDNLATHQ